MQKIIAPAKPWGEQPGGFEPDLRAWELDVGEFERVSPEPLSQTQ